MKFPLPQGHKYGVNPYDIRFHDPSKELADQAALTQWQHHVMLYWHPGLKPNGFFDGETQKAVVEVQRVSGLMLTGSLDRDTWEATFARGAGATPDTVGPETALESTESDEIPEGVPQGTLEEEPAQIGSETVVPVQPVFVKRGPGRPPKR